MSGSGALPDVYGSTNTIHLDGEVGDDESVATVACHGGGMNSAFTCDRIPLESCQCSVMVSIYSCQIWFKTCLEHGARCTGVSKLLKPDREWVVCLSSFVRRLILARRRILTFSERHSALYQRADRWRHCPKSEHSQCWSMLVKNRFESLIILCSVNNSPLSDGGRWTTATVRWTLQCRMNAMQQRLT